MRFNPEIHHRQSTRLQGFDYATAGAYFVTICANKREQLFGNILNTVMVLNETGKIVQRVWNELQQHYPDIECDEFIIMPNHVHMIVCIRNSIDVGAGFPRPNENKPNENGCVLSESGISSDLGGETPPLQIALGRIIAWMKYRSTVLINRIREMPGIPIWQRNYYERVIRDENELSRIQKYIIDNPRNWDVDPDRIAS